jgi:ribose transport system substrate-binding protein
MFTIQNRCTQARRLAAGVAASVLLVSVASGCSAGERSADANGPRIGFSLPMLNAPFYQVQVGLTEDSAHAQGMELLQTTDANQDPGKQITDIRNLISAGAQGLLVTPRDSNAIAPALEYAASKDVPVVAVDQGAANGEVAITVRADNVGMAQIACKALGDAIGGQGKVLELQGDLVNVNGRDRAEGFENCIRENYPGIEVIARPTKWLQANAASAAQTVLTANPDVKGIYMASDSIMVSAVLSVLQQLGLDAKVGEEGHVYVIGIDGAPEALDEIRASRMDATVSQPLDQYARLSVDYLKRAMNGEKFAAGPTDHDSEIRQEGPNLTDFLTAPLVTMDNVDDPNLWANQQGVR